MEPLLRNIVIVFLLAGGLLHLFHRVRLPSVVGLILAGVLIGPHGFGVLEDRQQIEMLTEVGVMLLMFSIGLDFTRERLRELLYAAGMGTVQIAICVVGMAVATFVFVDRWQEAVFLGLLVSHTSSTLMLKLFLDRGELASPPVRLGLGISITQDLSVVLMLLAVPLMAGGQVSAGEVGIMLLKVVGVLALAAALSHWVVPPWMERVIRARSRELFLIFLIVVALGTAWTTLLAGLSVGLGAFLAGIAIAGSGYGHYTLSEVAPFRDLLISVFFLSIGMLVDVGELILVAWLAVLILVAVLLLKFTSGFLPALIWGYPLRVATSVGTGIAQIGEFGFVLALAGYQAELIRDDLYAMFLLVAVASMIVSPLLVSNSPRIAAGLAHWRVLRTLDRRSRGEAADRLPLADHVIIAGFGLNGQNLATALETLEFPYVVLEMNPETVQSARRQGLQIFYGDCSRVEVLRKLNIDTARGLVLAVSDPQATRQAVQIARHENPGLHIIARTKYMTEIDALRELGASEVVAEEFETSLEVLALTLRMFDTPRASIDRIVEGLRSNAYRALRGELPSRQKRRLLDALIPEFDLETHELTDDAPAVGKTLRDLDLRAKTGATLLAVRRAGALVAVPPADFRFRSGDVLVLAGAGRQIGDAVQIVAGEQPPGSGVPASAISADGPTTKAGNGSHSQR